MKKYLVAPHLDRRLGIYSTTAHTIRIQCRHYSTCTRTVSYSITISSTCMHSSQYVCATVQYSTVQYLYCMCTVPVLCSTGSDTGIHTVYCTVTCNLSVVKNDYSTVCTVLSYYTGCNCIKVELKKNRTRKYVVVTVQYSTV